jgi:hypothetical protein
MDSFTIDMCVVALRTDVNRRPAPKQPRPVIVLIKKRGSLINSRSRLLILRNLLHIKGNVERGFYEVPESGVVFNFQKKLLNQKGRGLCQRQLRGSRLQSTADKTQGPS